MDWDQLSLTLDRSNHVRCEVGWDLPRAFSENLDDYDLWFIWAGQGIMHLRDRQIQLHPGICVWMRPGGIYDAQQDITNRLGVSAQHFDLMDKRTLKRPRDGDLPPEIVYMPDIPAVTSTMRTIARLRQASESTTGDTALQAANTARTMMQALLMEVHYQANTPSTNLSPTDHMHRSVITQMAADMTASPQDVSSIEALADLAGYSPAHFSRVFKQVMGVSPQRHLMEARIGRAKDLLLETDWSITRIADVLGYNDVYFFSRQFKHVTGQTPSAIRRS